MAAITRIRECIDQCEAAGVEILCCPEAILGGLADYAARPSEIALHVASGQLAGVLRPLSSKTVTTIVGFTEITGTGELYNSAAVFHEGDVAGVYRKRHPAIRQSIYRAGDQVPVFHVGALTFGIIICNDSNFPEPAETMVARGATTLFVPSNNGLPVEQADVVDDARKADIARAMKYGVSVVRADVAGRAENRVSYGSSAIVCRHGLVLQSGPRLAEGLLVADIDTVRSERQGVLGRHDSTFEVPE